MTVVYISRHSQPFSDLIDNYNVNEGFQIRNEKNPLSVEGEVKAKRKLYKTCKKILFVVKHYLQFIFES